ncbi:hypothetical protein BJ875DRAFT_440457 [Amylocarpus encephaloides]|uniref:Uncharacterized protein n=1 Tax=Amylocarpus encephaloides TaxID=45428 RepID=A0A9P8C667_9HELO|nr:hypothetical protein BJ875DRAFT_440457 [Amylocarpus encephaloides]
MSKSKFLEIASHSEMPVHYVVSKALLLANSQYFSAMPKNNQHFLESHSSPPDKIEVVMIPDVVTRPSIDSLLLYLHRIVTHHKPLPIPQTHPKSDTVVLCVIFHFTGLPLLPGESSDPNYQCDEGTPSVANFHRGKELRLRMPGSNKSASRQIADSALLRVRRTLVEITSATSYSVCEVALLKKEVLSGRISQLFGVWRNFLHLPDELDGVRFAEPWPDPSVLESSRTA